MAADFHGAPSRLNLHLFELTPLAQTTGTVILQLASGRRHIAAATSSNVLLLMACAEGALPPLTRQLRWFSATSKGIAALAMRDDDELLVATHDASAFVLPLRHMLRRPPGPVASAIAGCGRAPTDTNETHASALGRDELVAVHATTADMKGRRGLPSSALADIGVSCCTFCDWSEADGETAAIGSLDGSVRVFSLAQRTHLHTVDVGAPVSRLWSIDALLLARTLQGRYAATAADDATTFLPLALPAGELSVQRTSARVDPPLLLLLLSINDCRLHVYSAAALDATTAGGAARLHHAPLLTFRMPPHTMPGSVHLSEHTIFCVCVGTGDASSAPQPTAAGSAQQAAGSAQPAPSHRRRLAGSAGRVLILSRDLAAQQARRPLASTSEAAPAHEPFAVAGETCPRASHPMESSAASASAASDDACGAGAVLQSAPLPRGCVMVLSPPPAPGSSTQTRVAAPLGGAGACADDMGDGRSQRSDAPVGALLFASRSALYSLVPCKSPEAICRRLLRAGYPAGDTAAHATRVTHAMALAKTYGLNVGVLCAHAAARALSRNESRNGQPPPARCDAWPSAAPPTPPAAPTPLLWPTADGAGGLSAALLATLLATERSREAFLGRIGRRLQARPASRLPPRFPAHVCTPRPPSSRMDGSRAQQPPASIGQPPMLLAAAMAPLHMLLRPRPHWPRAGSATAATADDLVWSSRACGGDDDPSMLPPSRLARRLLLRLCCASHAALPMECGASALPRDGSLPPVHAATNTATNATAVNAALNAAANAAALAALAVAPHEAGCILAECGRWQPLLLHDSPFPALAERLRWLRHAASQGVIHLGGAAAIAPASWERLLNALTLVAPHGPVPLARDGDLVACHDYRPAAEDSSERRHGGHWGEESGADGGRSATAALCADVRLMLRLALLLPPHSTPAAIEPAVLGRRLEIFIGHWVAQGWPTETLLAELRAQIRGASIALCWLLEHRPRTLMRISLDSALLLDAVRVAACPGAAGA